MNDINYESFTDKLDEFEYEWQNYYHEKLIYGSNLWNLSKKFIEIMDDLYKEIDRIAESEWWKNHAEQDRENC